MPNKKSNQKGFTLVELLLSVAIIAILSTIGVASFQNYANRAGVKNAALELTSELRKYQNYAISGEKNPAPGITDNCALPGHKLNDVSLGIYPESGSTSSKIYISADCYNNPGYSTYYIKYMETWPDPKIAQVTKVGYILKDGTQWSGYGFISMTFTPRSKYSVQCLCGAGSGLAERVFVELSKGTTNERVYITTGGLIYEQKP